MDKQKLKELSEFRDELLSNAEISVYVPVRSFIMMWDKLIEALLADE